MLISYDARPSTIDIHMLSPITRLFEESPRHEPRNRILLVIIYQLYV